MGEYDALAQQQMAYAKMNAGMAQGAALRGAGDISNYANEQPYGLRSALQELFAQAGQAIELAAMLQANFGLAVPTPSQKPLPDSGRLADVIKATAERLRSANEDTDRVINHLTT